jgi:anaerobic selenocysteine-containing dehydrogenase
MSDTKLAICRFCHSFCGIKVTIEDGKPIKVVGDKDSPMHFGYTCARGRQLPQQHANPDRLLHPQHLVDGGHRQIASPQALDAIASQLSRIIATYGPRAVAVYTGTYSYHYPAGGALAGAFLQAIESPMMFSAGSIDQPGKPVSVALHGRWDGGPQSFLESDVWMLVGVNPLISKFSGIPPYNPAKRLHDAQKRGLQLIVIDPRRTESAEKAQIHLQCKPGEDPTILAGMAQIIIEEGLCDRSFIDAEVEGFEAFKAAVAPFSPDYVSERACVPKDLLIQAARTFATGSRGMASAGTGPNMAPRGLLTEYLVLCLNTLCGRWLREGEKIPNPFVLSPERRGKAQAQPKPPAWGFGEKLRVRGLADAACGLSTAALADEILLDGDGQVRALICVGSNPIGAWPDQAKAIEALGKLDLCVTLDIKMSATAKRAHCVIPPKLGLESPAMTQPDDHTWGYGVSQGFPQPFAMYQPTLVDPPAGSDLLEEWEVFYGLAQRMGLQLAIGERQIDMVQKPSTDDIFEMITAGSRIPLSEVKKYPHGRIFDDPSITVLPKEPDCAEKLSIGHPEMMAELAQVRSEEFNDHAGYGVSERFSHRLISRRMKDAYNSSARDLPLLSRDRGYNPAFMNPGDMTELGLQNGDIVRITSDHASILGVVEAAPDVRTGVVSMAHGFGEAPEFDKDLLKIGSSTSRLVSVERNYDLRTGMPRMSAIPVNVIKMDPAECGLDTP